MKLFTIGHSNLQIGEFVAKLTENGVSWLVDVRSAPVSRRYPHFDRPSLIESLSGAGIQYAYFGDKIGGKPPGLDAGWAQGRLNYTMVSDLSKSTKWQEGLRLLAGVIQREDDEGRLGAIMCSEANPNACHRSLIAFQLQDIIRGLEIDHIGVRTELYEATFQQPLPMARDQGEEVYHEGDYH